MFKLTIVLTTLLATLSCIGLPLSARAEESPFKAQLSQVACGTNFITFKMLVESEHTITFTTRKENILSIIHYDGERVPTEARYIIVIRDETKGEGTSELLFSEYAYDAILDCLD